MGATYLKSFKTEIQIAFSFGLSGSFYMLVNFLFSPTHPVWFGMVCFFFFFSSLLLLIPLLTLNCNPMFFVRWVCWVFPPTRKWQHLPSPLQGTLRNLSHLLLRDGAGVCVVHWCVQKQHFDCSGVGLYNFKECLDFLRLVDYSLDTA